MKDIPAATGGYFFAARFTDETEELLLILMLNQEQGHAIDEETLTLKRSCQRRAESGIKPPV
jgi:hypothetical protein